MSGNTTYSPRSASMESRQSWPTLPSSGPTRRFELEYLVRRESARLCGQMKEAGIAHRALLELGQSLDPQRVEGYVDTKNLFVNCVAFHAEQVAEQVARDMDTDERRRVKAFLDNLRAQYPLSRARLARLSERPRDLDDVFRRSVQTD